MAGFCLLAVGLDVGAVIVADENLVAAGNTSLAPAGRVVVSTWAANMLTPHMGKGHL
jgi:hypothetical protein